MNLTRYADILADHGMVPFHREPWVNPRTGRVDRRVLGERPPFHWRVSRDEWDRLVAATKQFYGWATLLDESSEQLYGWPIAPDDSLPVDSVIFEPDA